MDSWLAPEIEVSIDNQTDSESVSRMVVTAARGQPLATIELEMSNVRFECEALVESLRSGEAGLVVRWGYRGLDLTPLFDGSVKWFEIRDKLTLIGVCRNRPLAESRITRTYKDEQAASIVKHLVEPFGYSELLIDDPGMTLDKLPMDGDSALAAIEWLTRRLQLQTHTVWADATGRFHWEPIDEQQESWAIFTHGEDVITWQALPGDRRLLVVAGTELWHSQVVQVGNREDEDPPRYFVEQVRHTLGAVEGEGMRTMAWLRRLS